MIGDQINKQVSEVQGLFITQMRVKGKTLETQLRKAGRRLPRKLRQEGAYLAQAATLAQNPKLGRMIDEVRASKAHAMLIEHLKSLDPADALKGRVLGILGSISAVLIVTFIIVVYVLVQRGLV